MKETWMKYWVFFHRFPLRACSRSMASKRLLKFPAPNPLKLFRWMISRKTVGRSVSGLVKIWIRYPPSSKSIKRWSLRIASKSSSNFTALFFNRCCIVS